MKTWFSVLLTLVGLTGALGMLVAGPRPSHAAGVDYRIRLHVATFDPLHDGEPAVPRDLAGPASSAYALLQFKAPPSHDTAQRLLAAGVTFFDYVPAATYVVHIPPGSRQAVEADPAVRWVGAYRPAYRLSPFIKAGPLAVQFFPGAAPAAAGEALLRAGASSVTPRDGSAGGPTFIVEARATTLPALAAIEGVRWIQSLPALQEFNDDARWVLQSGIPEVNPLEQHGLSGQGQVGAVADSGLVVYDFNATGDPNAASCYFLDDGNGGAGGTPLAPGSTHRKVVGYLIPPGAQGDFIDNTGHGSHVSGSVVGDRPPWNQLSTADGQAYRARLLFQDINNGGGVAPPADYRVMFGQAYDPDGDEIYEPEREPRTHSNSWGDPTPIYSTEAAAVDDFMWTHPDFLILFAAGNQGPAASTIGFPATAKNIVTVGATENGLADPNNMGYFSSHGPAPLGRLKPEVSAPGDRITSAAYNDPCGTLENLGTSMAAPAVQGIALLMRQYLWDGYYPSGTARVGDRMQPSAALLKALLMNSSRRLSGTYSDNVGQGSGSWPSNGQGWGRVTADDALYFQGDHRSLWLTDEYDPTGSSGFANAGESRTFTVTVADAGTWANEPLAITLAWTDYQGTPAAGGGLVNDLDLVVTDPLGGVHRGNERTTNDFVNPVDLPLASPDTLNPWEVVYLAHPPAGTYTVTVQASSIGSYPLLDPARKQGFALVMTGDLRASRGRAEIEYSHYDAYSGAVVRLRVTDRDLNLSATAVETATAHITSTSDLAGINVVLTETGPASGVFDGQVLLQTAPDAGHSPTPALFVAAGDTLRLTYSDADDGSGTAFIAFDSALLTPRPRNTINPPQLAVSGPLTPTGFLTLTWTVPETVTQLSGYVIQETRAYSSLLVDDAEGDINALWTTGQVTSPWLQDPQVHQSGLHSYWSGRGDAGVFVDTALTAKISVTLPLSASEGLLTFYSRYFNDLNDYGHVEVTADRVSWTSLRRLYADPLTPPAGTRLQHMQFDLSPWLGTPIYLRFRYDNGIFSIPGQSPGWWLDDIHVYTGRWQSVAVVAPVPRTLLLQRFAPGPAAYRVAGLYTDGSVTNWSNVVSLTIPCSLDFDLNGRIDIRDIQLLTAAWATADPRFDLNANGTVDLDDIRLVAARWNTTCIAD